MRKYRTFAGMDNNNGSMFKANTMERPETPKGHFGPVPKNCKSENVFVSHKKYGYECTMTCLIVFGTEKARLKAIHKWELKVHNWFWKMPIHEIIKHDFVAYTEYTELKPRQRKYAF